MQNLRVLALLTSLLPAVAFGAAWLEIPYVTEESGSGIYAQGDSIRVYYQVTNNTEMGDDASSAFAVAAYACENSTPTTDYPMGLFVKDGIPAAAVRNYEDACIVPAGIPAGTYSITLIISYTNAIGVFQTWCQTTNGITVVTNTNRADLAVRSVSAVVPDGALRAGGSVYLQYEVANQGGMASDDFRTDFYASPDPVITAGDYMLSSSVTLSGIPDGVVSTYASKLLLPSVIPAGLYYLGVVVTCPRDIYLTNNTSATAGPIPLYAAGGASNAPTISCEARQLSDGSGKVLVGYSLSVPGNALASVDCCFSTNGGGAWNVIPTPAALAGDYGAGVDSGTHQVTWNAAMQFPSNMFNANVRARVTATSSTGSAVAISLPFTVDLAGLQGGLTVKGTVVDADTLKALTGVVLQIGDKMTVSADGKYMATNVAFSTLPWIVATKPGYCTNAFKANLPPGLTQVEVPCIQMTSNSVGRPVIASLAAKYDGIFIAGVPVRNTYTAAVDWNRRAPGSVRLMINDNVVQELGGAGPVYAFDVDMATSFNPSFDRKANEVRVVALDASSMASRVVSKEVLMIPLPPATIKLMPWFSIETTENEIHAAVDFDFPDPPIKSVLVLPVIGKFGAEFAANASFDYTVTDGDWEAALGVGAELKQGKRGRRPKIPGLTRSPKMKLYIGNKEILGKLTGGARGTATLANGIAFNEVFGRGELSVKLELGRVGVLDLLGPGLSSTVGRIPGLSDLTKTVSVIIYVIPGIDGEIVFALQPKFEFKSAELTGKVGLEASYEPNLGICDMRLYVGGEPSVTLQIPGPLFKEFHFRAYAGAEFKAWIITLGPAEYVFADLSIPEHAEGAAGYSGAPQVVAFRGADSGRVGTIDRSYQKEGLERFVAGTSTSGSGTNPAVLEARWTALDAFRAIGQSKPSMALTKTGKSDGKAGIQAAPPMPRVRLANLPLIENAFPYSQPALAGLSTDLMLLYVTDNGNTNKLQFTDIKWTRWDGLNWSEPVAISTDTRAEFSPQVCFDGNGDAVAVWERVSDPNFTNVDLTAMARQMEIVWARWDHDTGSWSTPAVLTANAVLDHAPMLCGPMANGDVFLTWTKNAANLLMGTGVVGAVQNDSVMWTRWSAASASWASTQTLVSNLPWRLSQSLAGINNKAVYAWTCDMDGALTNDTDQELFCRVWSDDSWGPISRYAVDTNADKNVRVAVAQSGDIYAIWRKNADLVMDKNFSHTQSLVRADSQSAGFMDYTLALGPAGNLAMLWQEMSEAGSDAHCSVYDPIACMWSKDERLFQNTPLERSFAPVWDDVGNLTVAYNEVDIQKTNKVVQLEGGGSVTVSNVPQPGRVDLAIFKKELIKDVALLPGEFSVEGANYLPNDLLTLSARVSNVGDVAVSNVVVGFYDGDPAQCGTPIAEVAVGNWLEGGSTDTVATVMWVVPGPATNHTLYAIVNPSGAIAEFDGNNNTQKVSISGTDLSVSLLSYAAQTDGTMRVVAEVHNIGAPSATNSMLTIRRAGEVGTPLAAVAVPAVPPGRLVHMAVDLPAGTVPERDSAYTLCADEGRVTGDIDTNNNSATFGVYLWKDSDGDSVPDWWMLECFGHVSGLAGDRSRSGDDYDGDGMSNAAEFQAGTDPKNDHSYLRTQSLAVTNGVSSGIVIRWGSVSNRTYTVNRALDLRSPNAFTPLMQHIAATPPENSWVDSTATNSGPYFYRMLVE